MLLALVFAVVTVRMVSQLIRGMEWQTAELGRVSWHMLEDQEATARRFSHELHDELGQSLTAVKTNLAALDSGGPRATATRLARLRPAGGRGHRQRAPDVATAASHDPRRFRTGGRLALAGEGFAARTGIEVKFDSDLLRPASRRDGNAPVPHRAGGAHERGASRRREARDRSSWHRRATRSACRFRTTDAVWSRRCPATGRGLGHDRHARARAQRRRRRHGALASGRGCSN